MRSRPGIVGLALTITVGVIAAAVLLSGIGYGLMGSEPIGPGQLAFLSVSVSAVISPFVVIPLLHKSFQLKRMVERLDRMAFTDELTGLPNRRWLFDAADDMFDAVRIDGAPLAALMVDIDRFKALNDCYGHETGDIALKEVARRISTVVAHHAGANGIIGRLGGEEFAILVKGLEETRIHALAQAICASMREEPVIIKNSRLNITLSVGVAMNVGHLQTDSALNLADDAVYDAKESGRNRWVAATVPPVSEFDNSLPDSLENVERSIAAA